MTDEQSMVLGISIVLCVCLTINSIILIRDSSFIDDPDFGFLDLVFGVIRILTLAIMWRIWWIITFELVPLDKPCDNSVDKVEQKQEQSLEINLPT